MAQRHARAVETDGATSGLEKKLHTIIAVAGGRVYHSKLQSKDKIQWNYSHWKGTLTLGRDIDTPQSISEGKAEKNWFRLADDESGSTIWIFKFTENFEYEVEQPFFHVFQGKSRRYGFLFNDDDEAALFGKKVMNEIYGAQLPNKRTHRLKNGLNRSQSLSINSIPRSMISSPAPDSFRHLAHVGVNKDGIFEVSKDIDPSWREMLSKLQGHGVTEATVIRHQDFVEGFWKGVEAMRSPTTERFEGQNELTRKMTR